MGTRAGGGPLVVRSLRRGEEALWSGVRRSPRARRRRRPRPFTREEAFVAERHLVAERGGRAVGKMEWLRGGLEGVLTDPVVVRGEDVSEVCDALLREGLRRARRRAPRVIAILHERNPHRRIAEAALLRLGFRPTKRRRFHRRRGRAPRDVRVPGVEFAPVRSLLEPRFVETLARCAGDPAESVRRELRATCRPPAADWRRFEIAVESGRPVGVVLPAWLDVAGKVGTMHFVGVVPEARGRGIGRALTVRAIRVLASLGMREMKDATDDGNDAMVAVFRATGYRQTDVQHYYDAGPAAG